MPVSAASFASNAHASKHGAGNLRLGLPIGLLVEAILLLVLRVPLKRMAIGKDGRLSTSKTVTLAWNFLLGAMLLAVVWGDAFGHSGAIDASSTAGVVGQYSLLVGGPLASAILAKGIVSGQLAKDPTLKPPTSDWNYSDLVTNDVGESDLGDLQYMLFNIIGLISVVVAYMSNPADGVPHLPGVLVGLTSISAAGFVGKKALPIDPPAKANLLQVAANAGAQVTIEMSGLSPVEDPSTFIWVRFGLGEGNLYPLAIHNRAAAVQATVPPAPQPVPAAGVDVNVTTATGIGLVAGRFSWS